MRTTQGPKRVDVIYRRVDDDFLDPLAFRPDSTLGCAGCSSVYRAGNVTLSNAIGTGVADDKSIYPYVPKMIEFYLGEKPILNNVPTYLCREADDLKYVLDHLGELVVKEVHGAGGYGMLVGPAATKAEIADFRKALEANPAGYIAQPTLSLSTCPTFVESGIAPRHIDLRPFVLSGKNGADGAGRPDARGAEGGLAGRQLVAGRRYQGHLGAGGLTKYGEPNRCCHEPPTTSSGWRATWSGPRTPRACSTSTTRPRCCRSRPTRPRRAGRACSSISELSGDFAKRYGEVTPRSVMDYMVSDAQNPSSIRSCLMAARENARAVRGTLTTEVWETQNQTWLEFQRMVRDRGLPAATRATLFEWVKFRSHLSRGVTVGTMLQDEAFHFLRIGSFLERADNTARLLDVKFHAVESEFFGAGAANGSAGRRHGRRVRLLSLVGDPALGLGLRGLPQGLPQRDPAREGGRAADPARRHAALAGGLHGRGGRQPEAWWPTSSRARRCAGRPAARRPAVRPHRRDPRHRPARLPDAVPRARGHAGRGHQPRLPRAGRS